MQTKSDKSVVAELVAWDQWKAICSILGCPQPSRSLLTGIAAGKFSQLLSKLTGDQIKLPAVGSEREKLAHEFDVGIVERDQDAEMNAKVKVKHYKDWVWRRIKEGDTPALQCIHGLLFGQNGPLQRTVRRWVRKNCSVQECMVDGKRRFRFSLSLDKPLENGDSESSGSWGDKIPAAPRVSRAEYASPDDRRCVDEWMAQMSFTPTEAIVLLAKQFLLSVDSDEMKTALHHQKSGNAKLQQEALDRIRRSFCLSNKGDKRTQAEKDVARSAFEVVSRSPLAFMDHLVDVLLPLAKSSPDAAALVAVVEKCRESNGK